MRKGIVTLLSVLICFLLQSSVFELIKLAGTTPNILIILVSSTAVMRGQKEGMITGFFSGLLLDIFYCRYLGGFAFLYMIFGFIDGYFNRIYYTDDNVLPLLLIGGNDLVYGLIMYLRNGLLHGHLNVFQYLSKIIFPEIVYTVAIGFLLYRVLLKVHEWLMKYEKGSADLV